MPKYFYITTTLPYVNADPHVGFAMEIIRADIIARFKKLQGYEVFFNTGTDEHGQKLFKAAEKAGKSVKTYVDENAETFKKLLPRLGISADAHFIRTTDAHHEKAAQAFWERVASKTDDEGQPLIYKKNYSSKYCVGCEETKTESELVLGRCPIHPQLDIEIIEEENYFFRFSAFGDKILRLYETHGHMIVPGFRMNEMREFIKRGLEDFSISRLKSKMAWGVPIPGDSNHVMYVWFDALVNYISTLGWPENESSATGDFQKFWVHGTPTQYCGKDNTRFQSVMWQAMLMAAGVPPTHTVVVNGFVTGEGGVKMSKSLGNVIDPIALAAEYDAVTGGRGAEALRYFVSREIGSFEDSPFTLDRFKQAYNTALANGLGNLVSRVMKMASTHLSAPIDVPTDAARDAMPADFKKALDSFDIQAAANIVWARIAEADRLIQEKAPFKLVKTDKTAAQEIIRDLCDRLYAIASMLEPILPETSRTIQDLVKGNNTPAAPLFARKE
ncbi:MAG: methionine--tRNA ligase [Patescibacteria group bacterium]|nr:methionine--tRNA ligase [Patescibacteria group bacterium]MDE2116852.1 methionine--tRNA ligase [Patescibacteria group bacterium]